MGRKPIDPRQQFSKKLAMSTAVFWFFYMTWLSVLLFLVPVAAQYVVYMGIIATIVMMVDVVAYTHNSIQEKILMTVLDKTKLEVSLGGKPSSDTEPEEGGEDG
jgi:hypothetical protein